MANRTISGADIKANGCQIGLTASGGTWTVTTVDPTKIRITVTSEGYNSSGVLGTVQRNITCVSQASGLTLNLSEPIYNDDTNVLIEMDAGAITSATDTNLAMASTSVDIVTTPSTLDYPTPTAHLWCEPAAQWGRVTTTFKVRAIGVGAPLNGSTNAGIACAELTITDAGSVHTQTLRQSAWTQVARTNSYGHNAYYPAFEFTVDSQDCDGAGTDFATGWATLSLSIKPYCGDAASVVAITQRVYLEPGGTAIPATKYVDCTSTITLSAAVAATFTPWSYIKGGTSNGVAVVVGTQSGSTLLVTVLTADANGVVANDFQTGETITEYTDWTLGSATGITATTHASTAIVHNGSDSNTGASGSPYRTLMKAGAGAETGGTSSGCEIRVQRGAIRIGPYTFGNRFSTANGCVIIKPDNTANSAGVSADTVRLFGRNADTYTGAGTEGGFDIEGLRTQFVRFTGFYTVVRSDIPIATANGADGTDADGEHVVIDSLDIAGCGRADTGVTDVLYTGFEKTAVIGCRYQNAWEGVRGQITVDSYNYNIGQDVWSGVNGSNRCVVNCYGHAYQESGVGAHSGLYQLGTTGTISNVTIWCCYADLENDGAAAFTKQNASGALNRIAIFGTYQNQVDSSNASRIEGGTVTNFFDVANSMGGARTLVGSGTAAFSNIYQYNNVYRNLGYDQTGGTISAKECWYINCHNVTTTTNGGTMTRPVGYLCTTGSDGDDTEFDALFSSSKPTSATILDRLLSTPQYPRDAGYRLISTDATATGAIGAYQPTPVLTVTYDGASVSDGGTVTETAGTKSLVMSAATGPTGSVVYISSAALGGTVTGTDASPYTLTSGGSTQSATISTSLTAGAATVDITYDLGSIFDFDITGEDASSPGYYQSRTRVNRLNGMMRAGWRLIAPVVVSFMFASVFFTEIITEPLRS